MKTSTALAWLARIALLLPANSVALGQDRPIALSDLEALVEVRSPQVAPDGKSIVVVVSRPDYEKNRQESRLVLVDIASGAARDLTFDRRGVRHPRWSPAGDRLAFVATDSSGDEPHPQVFVLSVGGGEARVATAAHDGVGAFEWSADGKSLFYIAAAPPAKEPEGPERHNKSFVVGHHDYLVTARPPALHV